MFRAFKISMNRVHDRVKVTEGGETLTLNVEADPMRMVAGLSQAQKMMQALTNDSTDEEQHAAAEFFASVIFGQAQAKALLDFYRGDAGCVIGLCGTYFRNRLSKLITKAQKKSK